MLLPAPRPSVARLGASAVAVALLLAACGGDDPAPVGGNATSTTGGPVTTIEVSTTLEVTTTTAPGGDPSPAPSPAPVDSTVVLTPSGLGPLQLGMSEADAAGTGFIGAIGPGCELSGSRFAPLAVPAAAGDIQGTAEFADGALGIISVTSGATTEEGTAIGDSLATVEATYATGATVDVDRSFEEMFGIWIVTVIRGDGGVYQLVVNPTTESVVTLAIPGASFCE
ncbi:MAG: hypothetical protein M3471_07425 [Actinomycetota bacterium]|nr:hypothetical protein [Actinomycetota bacterium]